MVAVTSGVSPLAAYGELLRGALGSRHAQTETLARAMRAEAPHSRLPSALPPGVSL